MNEHDIEFMLDELDIPYSYLKFDDDVCAPFLIYVEDSTNTILADGEIYLSSKNYIFEIYSDTKDYELIHKVEYMFSTNGIRFKTDESWIEKESLFVFTFKVNL